MRVLIADDDPLFRGELASLLGEEGHESVPVESADAAIAALEAEWFDVLLTDLRMPRKSGTVLLDEVAVRWPGVRSIILTGQPSDEAIASSLRHRAFNFIGKPFQLKQVLWVLGFVREDVELGYRVAPAWEPGSVRSTFVVGPPPPRRIWGAAVAGLPTDTVLPIPSSGGPPSGPAPRAGSAPEKGPTVVHLSWPLIAGQSPERLLRFTEEVVRPRSPSEPIVVIADQRMFATPELLALWRILRGEPVPPGLDGVRGPQRRLLVQRLDRRELELNALQREVDPGGEPDRTRLYLEQLVVSGLVTVSGKRYRLTVPGEEVASLLRDVDAVNGRLPAHRWLFSEPLVRA
ncbi:MAG TPA: response regulator [Thermoplasmata archaeon]|nr:response regulator [Thermoplasmata archaeon]